MAYPTLFPHGKADFSLPRRRTVTLQQWSEHLIRYKDGRFGSHPRFRYMGFNQIMRDHVRKASNWLVKKSDLERNNTQGSQKRFIEYRAKSTILYDYMHCEYTRIVTRSLGEQKPSTLMLYSRS